MTELDQAWRSPPPDLALSRQAIHVWRVSLEKPVAPVAHLTPWLSPDEQARANRFRFARDRRRFTIARATLRLLVGRYLGCEPDQVQFDYGPQGKPSLSNLPAQPPLRFNLAHANELAVYAFAREREVGVDVEYLRPIPEVEQIALRFFSDGENASLQTLPDDQKQAALFNGWTRKEAYLKALGAGLSHPLEQFQVSLLPGEPARLLAVDGLPDEAARWRMLSFVPAAGYVAALVAEGPDLPVEYWQFEAGFPS